MATQHGSAELHRPFDGLKPSFILRRNGAAEEVSFEQLTTFAEEVGLAAAARKRYSALLAFQLMAYRDAYGLDPERVVSEIRDLEAGAGGMTKPATPYRPDGPLAGLWHKHFTSSHPSIVAGNILAARPTAVLSALAAEELSQGATADALERFAHRVVVDGYERRAARSELTGEWLVYLPSTTGNLYLCLATHAGGNAEILGYLRSACVAQFPFLREALPRVFVDEADQGSPSQPSDPTA